MVERLGWTLVHFVWQGTAVALLLAVALWMTRGARARYALACLALAVLAVAPVATFQVLAPGGQAVATATGRAWTQGGAFLYGENPYEGVLPILVRVWIVGVAILSLRLGGTLLQVERWRRRHTRPAPEEWQTRLDVLAESLRIRRRIAVLVSDRIAVPSAWGVMKAVVVLPTSLLTQITPDQVETILLHELAHIRRHDYLVNLLQAVVETVLFYHPAVWWVSSVVRREREHCCDDVVVARLPDPMPYARALLHLEERRRALPRPTLSATESNLMNRIARILAPRPAPRRVSPLASSMAALGVLAAIMGGALQAQAQGKAPAPAKKPVPQTASKGSPASPTAPAVAQPAKAAKPASAKPTVAKVAKPAPAAPVQSVGGPYWKAIAAKTGATAAQPAAKSPARAESPATDVAAQGGVATAVRGQGRPGGSGQGGMGGGVPAAVDASRVVAGQGGFGGGSSAPAGMGGGFGGGGGLGGYNGGGGFGRPMPYREEDDITIEWSDSSREATMIDTKNSSLPTVMRMLAKRAKASVVISGGDYNLVTLVLSDVPFEKALQIICRTADAKYRLEGGVYFIDAIRGAPAPKPASGFGGGGFGGIGGGAANGQD